MCIFFIHTTHTRVLPTHAHSHPLTARPCHCVTAIFCFELHMFVTQSFVYCDQNGAFSAPRDYRMYFTQPMSPAPGSYTKQKSNIEKTCALSYRVSIHHCNMQYRGGGIAPPPVLESVGKVRYIKCASQKIAATKESVSLSLLSLSHSLCLSVCCECHFLLHHHLHHNTTAATSFSSGSLTKKRVDGGLHLLPAGLEIELLPGCNTSTLNDFS